MQNLASNSPQNFYPKLLEVVQIYSNIDAILEKIHRDNSLTAISSDFERIIESEVEFTING